MSNCFYVVSDDNKVWKIEIDDHTSTVFLNFSSDFKIHYLAISSDGRVAIGKHQNSYEDFAIDIYGSDAKLITSAEFPQSHWFYRIFHVHNEQVFLHALKMDDSLRHATESFLGIWNISSLKYGVEEADFIWKVKGRRLNETVDRVDSGWQEVPENSEDVFSYFDSSSNRTTQLSENVSVKSEVMARVIMASASFDSVRNSILVCMEIFEIVNGERIKSNYEIGVLQKCRFDKGWCFKRQETLGPNYSCYFTINCFQMKDNISIRPHQAHSDWPFPWRLFIHYVA